MYSILDKKNQTSIVTVDIPYIWKTVYINLKILIYMN